LLIEQEITKPLSFFKRELYGEPNFYSWPTELQCSHCDHRGSHICSH